MQFHNRPGVQAGYALILSLALAACGGSSAESGPAPTATPEPTATPAPTPPDVEPANFEAHGSVNQVWVIGADEDQQLDLIDASGVTVRSENADENGAMIFRKVPAGTWRVGSPTGGTSGEGGQIASVASEPLTVTNPDQHPPQEFYEAQVLTNGYQYLETRDGTLMAVNVILPGPPEDGPYPTVIEYSGYSPADPDSPQPSMLIASVLGYAVVGGNKRGTGCSGGAYEFFEDVQNTDGYDLVETVAAQPWSANVGMVGISYPGITQLFVAKLRPPSLAAIAPLSVISDTGRGTLRPGGILNNGFAYEWAGGRDADSKPGGQGWSRRRLENGDQTCIDNMQLRSQTPDIFEIIAENEYYVPEVADAVAPATFVDQIEVPVFLAGSYNDEQTGGYFANMIPSFTGTDDKRFHLTNGLHIDVIMPEIFSRWMEFLDLFVAERVPVRSSSIPLILSVVAGDIFKAPSLELPPARFVGDWNYEEALEFWRNEPQIRLLMENGGHPDEPGTPYPTFEVEFEAWPPPAEPTMAYLLPGGVLGEMTGPDASESFVYDTSFAQVQTLDGVDQGGPWVVDPGWKWQQRPDGTSLVFTSAPLAEDELLAGTAAAHLWTGANVEDVDLQVTLSEVRSDGIEIYIQDGWLRTSRRALDEELSTIFRPVATHLEEDAAPLPAGELTKVSIEIFPFAHFVRAGSSLRIEVTTPGGTRPRWRWETLEYDDEVNVEIGLGGDVASHVVLPVVTEIAASTTPPATLPACPGMRGLACRNAQ